MGLVSGVGLGEGRGMGMGWRMKTSGSHQVPSVLEVYLPWFNRNRLIGTDSRLSESFQLVSALPRGFNPCTSLCSDTRDTDYRKDKRYKTLGDVAYRS